MTMPNTLPPNDGKEYILTDHGWELSEKEIAKRKWFKVSEAARETGLTKNTIASAIKRGNLDVISVPDSSAHGYHFLISEDDLLEWIDDPSKIRNEKKHRDYLDYMKVINRKCKKTTAKKKVERPEEPQKPKEVQQDVDILQVSELILKLIKDKAKEAYTKGYEDGRLSIEHDSEEAYRRGVEEGKKQAKLDIVTLIKEVG